MFWADRKYNHDVSGDLVLVYMSVREPQRNKQLTEAGQA